MKAFLKVHPLMRMVVLLLLGAVLLPTTHVHAQEATGFLIFENGNDADAITLSGIAFQTASGASWLYGDVRTRQYNAPYPSDCSDRPANIARAVCDYSVSEHFFAWVGPNEGKGEFSFTDGTASFVAFDISAGAGVTAIAYDADDIPIAATYIKPNAGSPGPAHVQLIAPAGNAIATVQLEGEAGLWLLDNLATDAPKVPDQRPVDTLKPARITVGIQASPNLAVSPDTLLTLTITATNRGPGIAKDALLSLNLGDLPAELLDATFSRPGAWVSTLDSDRVEIRTGSLGPRGDAVIITLRLRVKTNVKIGTSFSVRLRLGWADRAGGGSGSSNQLTFVLAEQSASSETLTLNRDGDSFSADFFIPGEPVGLWYNTPAGSAIAIGDINADSKGNIKFRIDDSVLPPGRYSAVSQGLWSGLIGVRSFEVGGGS